MRARRENKEYAVCKAIATYLRLQYPSVLFHFDLAGLNLSKAQAGMTKALNGRGWPDLIILHPTTGKVMFLEIKAEGVNLLKRNGEYLTPHIGEQTKTLALLASLHINANFAIGLDDAINQINLFLRW